MVRSVSAMRYRSELRHFPAFTEMFCKAGWPANSSHMASMVGKIVVAVISGLSAISQLESPPAQGLVAFLRGGAWLRPWINPLWLRRCSVITIRRRLM